MECGKDKRRIRVRMRTRTILKRMNSGARSMSVVSDLSRVRRCGRFFSCRDECHRACV